MTKVQEVPIPAASSLLRALKLVHFSDAYQARCNPKLNAHDAYEAVFGYSPRWVIALMTLRGWIVSVLGLKHVVGGDFTRAPCAHYQVGHRVGLFSVQSVEPNELIVGDNDKHLDFRISVLRSAVDGVDMVTVSTAVEIHNAIGRLYMLAVKPFHRVIARTMVQNAVNAGRL